MSFAPASIVALDAYWESHGGKGLGIVGDVGHTVGYHLGRDRIYDGSGPGQGDADYSVQLPRDKAGLTNAASAIDLGRLDGTLKNLRDFSRWFVARCMNDPAVRRDIREVIYSPDGQKVQRYSGRDNEIHTGPGNGDASHLSHTHISFMRDSQGRDKVWLFSPYFAEEPDVPTFKAFATPKTAVVPTGTWLYVHESLVADPKNIQINPGREMPIAGKGPSGNLIVGYIDTTPTETEVPTYWARPADVTVKDAVTPAPPDSTPYSQADLDAARAAGEAAGATAGAAAERERIAEAEADRIRAT